MLARVITLALVVATVLLSICSADSADYTDDELYPWPPRGLRTAPSMRLRFGKRGTGVWGLAQRSMPSLRMRFGKRGSSDELSLLAANGGLGEDSLYSEGRVGAVQRRGGGDDRTPGLRLRFGKRDVGESMDNEGSDLGALVSQP